MKIKAALLTIFLLSAVVSPCSAADASVSLSLNKTAYSPGDRMAVTLTTTAGSVDNDWSAYAALFLPDGSYYFLSGYPAVRYGADVDPLLNAPVTSATRTLLDITLPQGLPEGQWQWAAALAKPGWDRMSEISWAPFTMSGRPAVLPGTDSAFGIYTSHRLDQRFMQAEGLDEQAMFRWSDRHMAVLGAHWTRYSLLAAWQLIEPILGGGYRWDFQGPNGATDTILGAVYAPGNDIHAVVNIQALSLGNGTPSRSPFTNRSEYIAFVKALAERYDGDGLDDAPGAIKVDYYQLGNEVQDWFDRGLTAQQYAEAARITLDALRSANPNAQLVMMGAFAESQAGTLEDRYKQAIKAMADLGTKPAAVDIHWWFWSTAASPWRSPVIRDARRYLDSLGLGDVQIWSMEDGAWSGCPAGVPALSEKEQAVTLVKRYAWGRANGLHKLFWQGLLDYYNFGGNVSSPFNSMGLVDDGEQNCSDVSRRNTPRVAYWSYQKLAEATDNPVAIPLGIAAGTHDDESVFAYDYQRREDCAHVYIVWREGGAGPVALSADGEWLTTSLIPDRLGVFSESKVSSEGGKLTIQADSDPVLISPAGSRSCGRE